MTHSNFVCYVRLAVVLHSASIVLYCRLNLAIFRKHAFQKLLVISVSDLVDTLLKVCALNNYIVDDAIPRVHVKSRISLFHKENVDATH